MPTEYPYFQAVFQRILEHGGTTTIEIQPFKEANGDRVWQSPAHLRRPPHDHPTRARQGIHGRLYARISGTEKGHTRGPIKRLADPPRLAP